MKKNDIAVLVLIVGLSLGLAYFLGQVLLGSTTADSVEVEQVEEISSDIVPPDPAIFNQDAINPSVPIRIGDSANQKPFGE